jgi:hypothetical protein
MTREEFDTLKERLRIATDLFSKHDTLQGSIAAMTKCFITVHSGDDVRAAGIRVKEQEAVRTIVLEQLNNELTEVMKKIMEF